MSQSIADALLQRARAGDLEGYGKSIASIPVQSLNTVGKLPAFQESVAALVPIATKGNPKTRLRALALIGRADNTTQQKEEAIASAARAAVRRSPPEPDAEWQGSLNPDERYYVALVIARADAPWVARYAARALIDEAGEPRLKNDVRRAYAELLFSRTDLLATAFRKITDAVPGSLLEDPGTKEPELSRAKRLGKLLPAIEDGAREARSENGDSLAGEFNEMMQGLVFRYGRPTAGAEADEAASGVAEGALSLLSTLLRTRFLISVETESYKTVGRTKYWLKTEGWPKSAAAARQRLRQTLLQAIALRARTGRASAELVAVLIQLLGDRRPVEQHLARLADDSGISASVQDWLRAGGKQAAPRFESDDADEASLRDVDSLLANSALRAFNVKSLSETEAKTALTKIKEHSDLASVVPGLDKLVNHSRALAADVTSLARRRSLSMFGTQGELVEAVPNRHRTEDGQMIVTEIVRIERPGIERVLPNGAAEVVLPAVVSQVESKRK